MSRSRLAARFAAVSLSLCLAPVALADAPPPPRPPTGAATVWKDLQILPKDIKKEDLKAIMKAQSKALGVDCDHCHEPPAMEKDTENKKIARQMMTMTMDINAKYIKDPKHAVTCGTCHRGKEKPEVLGK